MARERGPSFVRLSGRAFDDVWRWLAAQGRADALGGAEYRRVRRAWITTPQPGDTVAFILGQLLPPPLPPRRSDGSLIW